MNAAIQQVMDEVRGAGRFRWWALLAAWVVCVVGWTAVMFMPDMYEAKARVYVDTRTVLAPVLQGLTISQDVDSQLNLVRQSLLGRPQLEKVVREADLDLHVTSPEQQAALVNQVRERIQLSALGGGRDSATPTATVYTLGFQDSNRDTSLKVVDILLSTFVEETLGGKRTGSEAAQSFLQQQIQEYEQRLREAEQRLADFKRRNVGQMPGEQGDYFTRLQGEMEAVTKARGALSIATTRREELQRQLRGEVPFAAADRSGNAQSGSGGMASGDTATRIKEAQTRLDELLLRFTDRHPDVVATRETLAQLEQRQQSELEALRRGDKSVLLSSGASVNPVYQSIQLTLNQTEVEIAALRGEIADRERTVGNLRRLVDTVPEVEAEFSRLNRDYDVTRGQYTALVDRLEKARLGGEAESTESIRFEIIDPPTAGFDPVAPHRPRLLALVLVAGLGVGGGLAYLLHMMKPVFNSTRSLNEITALPVLGVVSMTWLDRYRAERQRGLLLFGAGTAMLVIVFAVVLQFNHIGVRLVQSLVG